MIETLPLLRTLVGKRAGERKWSAERIGSAAKTGAVELRKNRSPASTRDTDLTQMPNHAALPRFDSNLAMRWNVTMARPAVRSA